MTNAIEIRNLTKTYQAFTLGPIDLTLPMGCIMGFIGENGAGKSTTIKSMLGLIRRGGGTVTLLGRDPLKDRSVMGEIGVVLDSGFFPPEMNAGQLEKSFSSIYPNWEKNTFETYLRRFEIDLKKKVKDYSRGMTMKLSLASSLSHGAKLLILDEATSGLDPIVRDDILDLLFEFIQDEQHSVFLSSHITGDLEKIADYIAFVHKGRLVMCEEKDAMLDTYGLLKGPASELEAVPPENIVGVRRSEFGVTALVKKYRMPGGYHVEPATLDDIMLYSIKGEKTGKAAGKR